MANISKHRAIRYFFRGFANHRSHIRARDWRGFSKRNPDSLEMRREWENKLLDLLKTKKGG